MCARQISCFARDTMCSLKPRSKSDALKIVARLPKIIAPFFVNQKLPKPVQNCDPMLINRGTISPIFGCLKYVLCSLKLVQNHLNSVQNGLKSTIKECMT